MKKAMVILGLLALALSSGAQEQLSLQQQADKLFDRYEYAKSKNGTPKRYSSLKPPG
jgi:hypothetical protein